MKRNGATAIVKPALVLQPAALDLTLIVVTCNLKSFLDQCLQSIFQSRQDASYEVIVVDNHSSDGSRRMVREKYPGARLIENKSNRSYAGAVNDGIVAGRGRYFLALNNDVQIFDHTLDSILHYMEEHPEVGLLGPRNEYPGGGLQRTCCYFPTLGVVLAQLLKLGKWFPERRGLGQHRYPREIYAGACEVDWVSGAAMMVRRTFLQEVGLMDESYRFYYDETDWCLRAKHAGWKVHFAPVGPILHYGGESSKQFMDFTRTHAVLSPIYYFRKHHGLPHAILIGIFYALWLVPQIVVCGIAGTARPPLRRRFRMNVHLLSLAILAPFKRLDRMTKQ